MGSVSSTKLSFDNNSDSLLHRKNFNELYEEGKEIGVGSFASVHACYRKSDNAKFAVKSINKDYLTERELIGLRDEIQILKKISHKNVIKLVDVFDDGKIVSMVLELCNGKDLFDEIVSCEKNHFCEHKSAEIIYTLSGALQHLHENAVVHRDMKPENILFGMDGTIKITDFGLAHYRPSKPPSASSSNPSPSPSPSQSPPIHISNIYMDTCCGTPHYVAPEIITKNEYNYKCDMWSLGVILFIMLVGYQPFNANSLNQIYKLIAKGKYNFNSKRWNNVSDEAKNLVKCLLEIDPQKRYSAKDIKYNAWIIKHINRNKPHQA